MFLEAKALENIVELDDKDISLENGITAIIKLNGLYKKDENSKIQCTLEVIGDDQKLKTINLKENMIKHITD